jgi:hypothetical protein
VVGLHIAAGASVEVVANRVAADRGYRVVTIDKRLFYLA